MFASKTLTARNNDPEPYILAFDSGQRLSLDDYKWTSRATLHAPRPRYQFGTIAANPILVRFREQGGTGNVMWHDLPYEPTEDQKAHAKRVLSLLSSMTIEKEK